MVVASSSMLSQHLASIGTFVPRMASTLVQPWSQTAASNLSTLTPKAKLSPIWSNFAILTFLSLHRPQRIESSMAFRLLPEPLQGLRLPQVSPRWIQLPTLETSLNRGVCAHNRTAAHACPLPGHPSVPPHEPPRVISPLPPTPGRPRSPVPSWSPLPRLAASTLSSPAPVPPCIQATPQWLDFSDATSPRVMIEPRMPSPRVVIEP